MGKLYLLFKTDGIQKDIAAAHKSLEVISEYLENNQELANPEKLGQGWEIDLLYYDDTGNTNLTQIIKYSKELTKCKPNDIQEGAYYNIAYKDNDIQDRRRLDKTRRKVKIKCIKACYPDYIFDNHKASGLHLNYNDIIVIAKCRINEDGDDSDRFVYYSHLFQWRMENGDS